MPSKSAEILLVESFDALIISRRNPLDFAKEAGLIATFIRRYIRVLFRLSEDELVELLRSYAALHARAEQMERRGKSPLGLLQKQVEEGGLLGRILARHRHHLGALDCLLDTRATAALVHHLMRQTFCPDLAENITGCEFGAGLGILSVAGALGAVAAERKIRLYGFEQERESVDHAARVSSVLGGDSQFAEYFNIHFQVGDIVTDEPYQMVADQQKESGELGLWISETFGFQTPCPVISEDGETLSFTPPDGVKSYSADLEAVYDPFPRVLQASCRFFPGFLNRIATGRIVAFPDVVTPKVIINGISSRVQLADGSRQRLHEIGSPYTMLPHSVPSRWALLEKEVPTKKKHPFSSRKNRRLKK